MTRSQEPVGERAGARAGGTERGSVTVVVAAVVVLAATMGTGVLGLGTAATTRIRAQTAADAAALAAADTLALGRGRDAATTAAVTTAAANGARLVRCSCTGRVVDVEVSRALSLPGGFRRDVAARARAEIRPLFTLFAP